MTGPYRPEPVDEDEATVLALEARQNGRCTPQHPCNDCDMCVGDELVDELASEPGQAIRLTPASTVAMARPTWMWDRRIPVGGVTLMAGREGLGKTALACHLAARLTRGDLAGQCRGAPVDVIYVGQEDDRSSVLVPRLTAAGADLSKFLFVDMPADATFNVGVDTAALLEAARGRNVGLVIVDPLDSHLAGIDSHRKSEVQAAIAKLGRLSQELRCGALGLAHMNKGDARDLLTKVVGSVGFTTSVRSLLGVGEHPDDAEERLCVVGKANMTSARDVPALRFRVEGTLIDHPGGEPIDTARVVTLGEEAGIDPNAILTINAEERSERDEATDWLRSVLSDGPMPKAEITKLARAEGIKEMTLKRAARQLDVVSERDETRQGRPATWSLQCYGSGVTGQERVTHNMQGSDQGKHGESLVMGHIPGSDPKPPLQLIPDALETLDAPAPCRLCGESAMTADQHGPAHPLCLDEEVGP